MHETGLSEAIVAAAVRRAAGRRVTGLRVRIGGHPVDAAVVTQGIRVAAVGTVAADTAVDLVLEPMTVRCHECGRDGPITDHLAMVACPQCGGVDVDVAGDDDVVLESITVDTAELGAV
ncbi:hydrogenase/urease maturation nickel metallochaperone HypA [Micromonospora narathiwatensis]|uniref:Zn finger protein HypA/HybF (Possibly regulating hydrogenase expression) n=1 Tax=Micromonospora narathiwatensis TaxID=299146 RepID=A0A1A8ZGP0_9ACTN|nr:hydrogenase/urease maturation nickel metallochaperone HypA [Micromonospora narathiwatensis]SBT43036.1 Zn finger protein HypA/HybF (possibly regulating hydrogenase expression) [Micromonospora narathiwatensis]